VAKRAKTKTPEQLEAYRSKRDPSKTPEPPGDAAADGGDRNRFVVHEHHARRLHWDLRLEHDGVLLSFALPRGIPADPNENRLAVHTEDHPIEYLDFHGTIPKGEYGAGEMTIWDRGTYEAEKIEDNKIVAVFDGERVKGRYALFQTRGDDWMIHRMDAADPERDALPEQIEPMKATLAKLPSDDGGWGYEIKWDGVRAIAYCEPGHVRLESRSLREITSQYPEVGRIREAIGGDSVILDGELVAFDDDGRPSFQRLQRRMHVASESEVRRRMRDTPVVYVIFDLLYADGKVLFELPYSERRARLEELGLEGEAWQTPAYHRGDGAALQEASRKRDLEGIIAKRLDGPYRPGKRSREWLKVKNHREQEVVIGGWLPGKGRREGELGALLVGYYKDDKLVYAGKVGTGFAQSDLRLLGERLKPLERGSSPFEGRQPEKGSIFVEPELVGEVEFSEWTNAGTMRHPSYKGLRDDKPARDVVREEPAT
jgi:bifunctional non-homologous end joining protein LigD